MRSIKYSEFCRLVLTAEGTFSYLFDGRRFVCNPGIYMAIHGTDHLKRAVA